MAGKNDGFTERLLIALRDAGVDYRPNTKSGLKAFAEKHGITYTTLHKCVRKEWRGHVPEWDQLLKISNAVNKSIAWLLIGKEEAACRSGTPPDEYMEKAGAVLKSEDARLVKDFKKEILYFFEESRGLKQTMQNPTSEDGESLIQGHEAKKKTVA